MTFYELSGEEALDAVADLMEPFVAIFGDKRVADAYRSGNTILAAKTAIKEHKKDVIRVLAIMEGEDPETYKPSAMALPIQLLKMLNHPEIKELFPSRPSQTPHASSGSVMANTVDDGE